MSTGSGPSSPAASVEFRSPEPPGNVHPRSQRPGNHHLTSTALVSRAREGSRFMAFAVRTTISALFFGLLAACGEAPPSDLERYLDDLERGGKLTGSVLVARGGTVLVERGFGLADEETRASDLPGTQFRI